LKIDLPFAATPESLMTMGFDESLDNAARIAMRKMIELLGTHYGLAFHDAYRLCSVAANMRVTQFVNGSRIHVMFPRAILAGKPQPAFLDSI
jgi:acetamidase/formamidase